MAAITQATLDKLRREIGDVRKEAFPDDTALAVILDEVGGNFDAAIGRALWLMMTEASVFDRYASGYSVEQQLAMRQALASTYGVWERRFGAAATDPGEPTILRAVKPTYSTPKQGGA